MKALPLSNSRLDLARRGADETSLRPSPNRGRSSASRGSQLAHGGGGAPSPPSKRGSEASAASGAIPAQRPPWACPAVPLALSEGTTGIAHGIDTVGFAYRGINPDELRRIPEKPCFSAITGEIFPIKRLARGGWVLRDPMSGLKLGCSVDLRGRWLLWSEARLAALLAGDLKDETLATPEDLAAGEWRVRETAACMGVLIPDEVEATTRRCDLASDVVFASMERAQTFLLGLSTVNLPRWKRTVTSAPGSSVLESVWWSTSGGVQLRLYDKTEQLKESKRARYGKAIDLAARIIRLERQIRPKKANQLCPAAFSARDLAALFAGPLATAQIEPAIGATLDPIIYRWRNGDAVGGGTLGV
jgi:hypothetical protein